MQSKAATPAQYLKEVDPKWKAAVTGLRKAIRDNLPKGFAEVMSYGMLGYVVPHSLYPAGYHVDPSQPLPFMALAAQKNNVSLYHMGIYADEKILRWFSEEYARAGVGRLDLGKSCIRFKNPAKIPYALIGRLASKITVKDWIRLYESVLKR